MKLLEYTDNGYIRRTLVRDGDTDPSLGIPQDPPDMGGLDWEAVKRDLYLRLSDRGLLTLEDVQRRQDDFIWCITMALKRPLLRLYQAQGANDAIYDAT